jgi:hypothetical protein
MAAGAAAIALAGSLAIPVVARAVDPIGSIAGAATVEAPAVRVRPAAAAPTLAGCRMFPADNPWNQRVDTFPRHTDSAAIIARIQADGGDFLHADFGENPDYGIPFVVAPAGQPLVSVRYTDYGDESDPGPFPIPENPPIEAGSDRHLLVLDQARCHLHEFGVVGRDSQGWFAAGGATFDLNSNALRPAGWTSADAAGLPILPGLVRCDEVEAGRIGHAIRVTFARTRRAYIAPATHFASSRTDPDLPPMGLRLRLRGDFDLSGYTGQARVILQAFRDYGMLVADNGSNWFFQGAPGSCWDDGDLDQLKRVPGTAFEVVATGPVQT